MNYFLDKFLKGDFRQKKGHQLDNFGESPVDGRKSAPKETVSLAPFSFSIVSPQKNQGQKGGDFLNRTSLETTDIFRGAFLLCKGGDLCGIRIKDNGRRIAYFLITGEALDSLDREYRSGQALVNPLQLRESLNHLRDILFQKLQDNEERTRYDRKRKNRGHKKQR